MPWATIAASATETVVSTRCGARSRTSTTTSTSTSTIEHVDGGGVDAREVGDRDAQPLRVRVAAVRAGRGHEGAQDQHPDREHVDDAREVASASRETTGTRGPSGSAARLWNVQRDRDERDREQEVAHHADPRELHQHGDAAEHRVAEEQHEHHPRQPDEVAAARVQAGTRR